MLRTKLTAILLVLLACASVFGSSASQSKHYEMYSWKVKGTWHYSLVEGTGQVRKYEDVTRSPIVAVGTGGLDAALKKLSRGDEIIWMSDVPPGVQKRGSVSALSFKQPSRRRIKHWIERCSSLGIKLRLR